VDERIHEFVKVNNPKHMYVIRTKSSPNLALKCLLTNFARSGISFKRYIETS